MERNEGSSSSSSSRTLLVVRSTSLEEVRAQEDAFKHGKGGEVKHTQQIHDDKPLKILRLEEKTRQEGDQDQSQASSSSSSSSAPSKLGLLLNNRAATISSLHHLNDRLAKIREISDPEKRKELK